MLCATVLSLLDLPMDVLKLLPDFFTAVDWAKGPSQTCRALNSMLLPSLTLDLGHFSPWKVHLLWTSTYHLLCMLSTAKFEGSWRGPVPRLRVWL